MNPFRGRARFAAATVASAALVLTTAGVAQAKITMTVDPVVFGNAMSTAPVTGGSFGINYPCVADDPSTIDVDETKCPMVTSDTPLAGFPTNGTTYSILSTGNAADADNPNDSTSTGYNWGVSGIALGSAVRDYQVTRIDLGPSMGNCLAFDFRFLSEEFPEYVNAGFNDAFVAQLNSFAVNVDSTQGVIAPGNFAAGAGDTISVDASGPSAMTAELAAGTTYDGATLPLVARAPVALGSTNSLYLTLFDQGDGIYDSAVFLDNLRYETLPEGQCKSLAVDPYEGNTSTTQGAPTIDSGLTTVTTPVSCDLPPGPIGCNLTVGASVTFTPAKRAVRHAGTALAPVTLGSTTVAIPAGASQNVAVPVAASAKAAIAKAKKYPAKLKKKSKKLAKKAAKLKKQGNLKKAKKLAKKSKKLAKQAKKLKKKPLGTLTVSVTNTGNGAVALATSPLKR